MAVVLAVDNLPGGLARRAGLAVMRLEGDLLRADEHHGRPGGRPVPVDQGELPERGVDGATDAVPGTMFASPRNRAMAGSAGQV